MPTFYFVSPNPVTLSQPIDVNSVMNEALGIKTFPRLPASYEFGLHDNFQDAYQDWSAERKKKDAHYLIMQVRGPALNLSPEQQQELALKEDNDIVEMLVDAKQYAIVSVYEGKKRLFNIESPYTLTNLKATTDNALRHSKQFAKKHAFALSVGASVFSLAMAFSGNSFYVTALKWGLSGTLAFGFSLLLCLAIATVGYTAGKMIWKGLHKASTKSKSAKKAKPQVDLSDTLEAGVMDPTMTHLLVANAAPTNPIYELPPPPEAALTLATSTPGANVTAGRSDEIDEEELPLATHEEERPPTIAVAITSQAPTPAPAATAKPPKYVDVLVETPPRSTHVDTTNPDLLRLLKQIAQLEQEVQFGDRHNVVLAFSRAIREEPEEEVQIKIAEKEVSLLQGFRSTYQSDVKKTPGRRDTEVFRTSWNRAKDERKLVADLELEVSNLNGLASSSIYSM